MKPTTATISSTVVIRNALEASRVRISRPATSRTAPS